MGLSAADRSRPPFRRGGFYSARRVRRRIHVARLAVATVALAALLSPRTVGASKSAANDHAVPLAISAHAAKPALTAVGAPPVPTTVAPVPAPVAPVRPASQAPLKRTFPGSKTVALTFDDGPNTTFTPQILAVLARYEVKATFFMVGKEAEVEPALVRQVVAAGHNIGGHTWDHVDLTKLDPAGFSAQVDRTDSLLASLKGSPVKCVRPPFGFADANVRAQLHQRGLQTLLWTADSADWKRPGEDAIVHNALAGVHPGSDLLFHDSGPDMSQTVAALPRVIEALRNDGYQFVTVCN